MTEHTTECDQAQAKTDIERAAYTARWPHYCHTCNGQGVKHDRVNKAPHGEGPWWDDEFDPCSKCSDEEICPRCGQHNPDWLTPENPGPCPHCGWNWGEGSDDYLPAMHECYCDDASLWAYPYPN